jgi:hypothetical protein
MFDKEMKQHIRETLIGLHLQDASRLCADRKWQWRVVRNDNYIRVVTSTVAPMLVDTVNLELNSGIVTFIDFS